MEKRKILRYIIGGCIIGIAVFLVVSLAGHTNKDKNVLMPVIEEPKEEITQNKITSWKTYRNEEYRFEINYPSTGWMLTTTRGSYFLYLRLCRDQSKTKEESFIPFCISGIIYPVMSLCENLGWREIINNIFDCSDGQIYSMNFEKDFIANSGAKGYQVQARDARGEMKAILFPMPRLKWNAEILPSYIFFAYYLEDPEPSLEEIKIFNRVVSSFRFIEK